MKRVITLVTLIVTIISCATSNKINSISLGMTKEQVIRSMGNPNSVSAQSGVEYLIYKLTDTSTNAYYGITTDYYVRIIDGKVESYGRMGDFDSSKEKVIKIETNNIYQSK